MVTHHVEEIPRGFTHVLMLRDGQVVAQGPLAETLTAETLGRTFGMRLELDVDRWTLRRASGSIRTPGRIGRDEEDATMREVA